MRLSSGQALPLFINSMKDRKVNLLSSNSNSSMLDYLIAVSTSAFLIWLCHLFPYRDRSVFLRFLFPYRDSKYMFFLLRFSSVSCCFFLCLARYEIKEQRELFKAVNLITKSIVLNKNY